MKTLNKIRHSRPAKSLPQKLAFSFLALLFGFGLGVFAKFLDGLSADQIPQWLSFFDIRNFFGLPLPWVFTTLVIILIVILMAWLLPSSVNLNEQSSDRLFMAWNILTVVWVILAFWLSYKVFCRTQVIGKYVNF